LVFDVKEAAVLNIRLPSRAPFPVRIERQMLLQCHEAEAHGKHEHVEHQHGNQVGLPGLRLAGETAADPAKQPVQPAGPVAPQHVRVHGPFHVPAQRPGQDHGAAHDKQEE
jgi:hypothetical protein